VVQRRRVADAPDASAGAGAEGDTALDGGADEAGQHGRGLAEGIGRRAVIFRLELAAGEQPFHARADGGEDLRHVLIAGRGRGVKGERPWPSFAEDAGQRQPTITRSAGAIPSQRSLRIMSHLLQCGWLTPPCY